MKAIKVTYKEIFNSICDSKDFSKLGINEWYLNEGGDEKRTVLLSRKAAEVLGIKDDEFNRRALEENDNWVHVLEEEKKKQKVELEGWLETDLEDNVLLDGNSINYLFLGLPFYNQRVKITIEELS